MKKKQVSSYLSADEARILKESAVTQTDLLKEDILMFCITDADVQNKIKVSTEIVQLLNQQIELLEQQKQKHLNYIKKYEQKLQEYHIEETEAAEAAVNELNNVLDTNNQKRLYGNINSFCINKIPLQIAISISKKYNINLRILLRLADENLMKKELEGYSTLLKRYNVKSLKELK